MRRSDVVLLAAAGAGLFMVGVVWRPVFGDFAKFKDALECTSFIATSIAAIVAIYTLNAWKEQFRHAERFKSLKDLKDAATSLHAFRGYLMAVQSRCAYQISNGGAVNEELDLYEKTAREKCLAAIEAYNRAWGTAVVFFTKEEEASFSGPASVYTQRVLSDPMRIVNAYSVTPFAVQLPKFMAHCQTITDEAKHLYASTVCELEWMLRRNYRASSTK
ncbi:hypothetical protein [Pseudomonas sp. Xaverov 259]|uniref:hypothetical protein n=1 Tax=Pseudomonas sp. Xaverov 259 TaxID=2666086 RepID=UPI001C5A6C3B|nr:hypothetical protein [Pseudomonas sp. Xaverov 259]